GRSWPRASSPGRGRSRPGRLLPLEDGLRPLFLAAVDADPITAGFEGEDAAHEAAVEVEQHDLLAREHERLVRRRVDAAVAVCAPLPLVHLDRLAGLQALHVIAVLRQEGSGFGALRQDVALADLDVPLVDDPARRL